MLKRLEGRDSEVFMCVISHGNTVSGLRYIEDHAHKPSVIPETAYSAPCLFDQPV